MIAVRGQYKYTIDAARWLITLRLRAYSYTMHSVELSHSLHTVNIIGFMNIVCLTGIIGLLDNDLIFDVYMRNIFIVYGHQRRHSSSSSKQLINKNSMPHSGPIIMRVTIITLRSCDYLDPRSHHILCSNKHITNSLFNGNYNEMSN